MALTFGWKAAEVRESFWINDPDLVNVSTAARQAWQEDGDACHLRDFVRPGGKPSRITFRVLTPDEVRIVQGVVGQADAQSEKFTRATLMCFRIAVDFPDAPTAISAGVDPATGDATLHDRVAKERGARMLANGFVADLERSFPGIVVFYGNKVLTASFATEDEKKASSQPSTPTPSSSVTESPGTAAPGAPTP